jgi:hypothetical protein
MELAREKLESHIETVEVIGAERGLEHAANLIVFADDFEFFGGAADRKIIDYNLTLLKRTLGYAG